jgi:phosphatidylserine/phosphatidylglycerophosphate/cardiolipin synthase-like enzyme
VFWIAITLAMSALSLALPTAASVTSDATVAVCFAPEEDCDAFAVQAIERAEHDVLVSAYRLTVGSGVVGALIRAKERGVDVRVIADKARPRADGQVALIRWPPLACRFGSTIERAERMPRRWL